MSANFILCVVVLYNAWYTELIKIKHAIRESPVCCIMALFLTAFMFIKTGDFQIQAYNYRSDSIKSPWGLFVRNDFAGGAYSRGASPGRAY